IPHLRRPTLFPYTTLFRSEGEWSISETGTPQGAVASPLLANIYLHYVFDLWAVQWRKREATGNVIVVRYADDIVAGFEHEADARDRKSTRLNSSHLGISYA